MEKAKRSKLIVALALSVVLCFALFFIGLAPTKKALANQTTVNTVDSLGNPDDFTDADLYFAGYSLRWDNAEYADANSGTTGLRFRMWMTEALYTYITTNDQATTHILIYPASYLEGGLVKNLTKNSASGNATPIALDTTDYWVEMTSQESERTVNGTVYAYETRVYLNEIPRAFFSTDLAIRGYVNDGANDFYQNADNEVARSLAYVANAEKVDVNSTFGADAKEAIEDALLTFRFQLDQEQETTKIYGDKVLAPVETKENELFAGYTNSNHTAVWNSETDVITGNTKLVSNWVSTLNYYLNSEDSVIVTVPGLNANVTGASIGETTFTVASYGETVVLAGASQAIASGKYVVNLTTDSGAKYFAGLTGVKDVVTEIYASGETADLGLGEKTISKLATLDGTAVNFEEKVLTGVEKNTEENPRTDVLVLTDSANEIHLVELNVYTMLIKDDADAKAFFVGTEAGADGTTGTTDDYGDALVRSATLIGSYALMADVNLGTLPAAWASLAHKCTFDGLGHKISYTVDEAQITVATNKGIATPGGRYYGALFDYNFKGVVKNVFLDINLVNYQSQGEFHIIADYVYDDSDDGIDANLIDNVLIKINLDNDVSQPKCRIGMANVSNNQVQHLKDVTIVFTDGETWDGHLRSTLFDAAVMFTSTGGAVTSNYSAWVTGNNEEGYVFTDQTFMDFENVYVFVPDGVVSALSSLGGITYGIGANQHYGQYHTFTGYRMHVKYTSSYLYNYSDAKANVAQIGGWVVNYGDSISALTATFVGVEASADFGWVSNWTTANPFN